MEYLLVDNQHQKITGYRDQPQESIDFVNRVKRAEADLAELWKDAKARPELDQRNAAMARTHFEDGFMRLVRAEFRPESPWD